MDQTFAQFMRENYGRDELADIARAVDAGWTGLTYYTDTMAIYAQHADEIWEAIADDAEDYGSNVMEWLAELPFMRERVQSRTTFENALVWYMAERTARILTDEDDAGCDDCGLDAHDGICVDE